MKQFACIKNVLIVSLLLLIPSTISAYDFEVDGIYYRVVSLEDLTCAVTFGDNKYAGTVEIPATVTYNGRTLDVVEIGNSAFSECENLESVKIPSSIELIQGFAFRNSNIKNIAFPNSVKSIGISAFENCNRLTYISIPNSITEIGYGAFKSCSNLKEMDIEDGNEILKLNAANENGWFCSYVETIHLGRDLDCNNANFCGLFGNNLRDVTIGNFVTTISQGTFANCANLTNATISNSVTSIDNSAFRNCESLTNITIPNSVTSIGNYAFNGCRSLINITIPNSVTQIGGNAFEGCIRLFNVVIDDAACRIGDYAFSRCSSLTNVSLGNLIMTIGQHAFQDCVNLTDLVTPNSVTLINEYAFRNCSLLENAYIGSSVQEIERMAFSECSNLKKLVINDGEGILRLGTVYYDNGKGTANGGLFCQCPIETVYIGRNLSYLLNPFRKGDNPTTESTYLKDVTIGNAVTKIDNYMFSTQTNLSQINIGNSVASIGSNAFMNCPKLFTIYSYNPIPPSGVDNAGFTNKQYLNAVVYVPQGSLAAYQAADGWKNFWNIYEMDTSMGVDHIQTTNNIVEVARYSIDGKRLSTSQKGINIVEMSDGSRQKVLVK